MKRKKRFKKEKSRRGIYILPNIFTSLNIFCGFYAIIASIDGKFIAAAVAIIIGVIFDIMDGKIARATNTSSKFGIEYDSLADLISFGLAPGLMIFLWALKPLGRIGWLAAFLFMVCGALRLARFNSQVGTLSSDYFVGLPIPAGAGMSATAVLFCHKFGIAGKINPIFILILLYTLSFLMVSTIKYNSFKKPELFRKMNFNVLVAIILILIFIAAQPSIALFLLGLVYVISGPFTTM
ncbi:MAG: CDP-diacylglycerol--serine O-phosphatidyltransferase, partial [Desulfobacterales bacterium PC51MH44]